MAAEKPDFIQINYSVSTTNADKRLLPLARDTGVAVMINRAFDDGRLFARVAGKALPGWAAEAGVTSWAQMFLKFVISHPAVTVTIPATGKPDRQSDNLKAGQGRELSAAERAEHVLEAGQRGLVDAGLAAEYAHQRVAVVGELDLDLGRQGLDTTSGSPGVNWRPYGAIWLAA